MRPIREKKHRLPDVMYHGRKCVAFTANEANRQPRLARSDIHEALRERLASAGAMHGSLVPLYCLMPDHLHVIFLGQNDVSRPKLAIDRFKYEFGNWMEEFHPDLDLQKDYYDHIVRRSEGWETQARYFALNPVRKAWRRIFSDGRSPGLSDTICVRCCSTRGGGRPSRGHRTRGYTLRVPCGASASMFDMSRVGTEPTATRFAFPRAIGGGRR